MNPEAKRDHPEPAKKAPAGTHPKEDQGHEGAAEGQMQPTTPPKGPEYEDEPREG